MNLRQYLDTLPPGGQKQFADHLGVSKSYLSQMAAGTAPISPKRAVEIEQASHGVCARQAMFATDWADIWPELRAA